MQLGAVSGECAYWNSYKSLIKDIKMGFFRGILAFSWLLLALVSLNGQTDTLRLLFVGDIMGHGAQIKSAERVPGKEYDYHPCFSHVKPMLEGADLAIGNLEVTLTPKPPYTGYPMFKSPDALAEALKHSGFDLLVTANNHSNDGRGAGVLHTIETLRRYDFLQTGTFRNKEERAALYPLMVYKNGFKIAVLNYTYGTNGIPTEAPTMVNLIDREQIRKDLEESKARKPHFIIVLVHWGAEYQLTENADQRSLAQFMIEHGADMIIGAHPHVVQPVKWERVRMPDGSEKEALVAYSLGNFISNQVRPHTDGGLMLQVDLLHRKGVPYAEYGRYGMIPVFRYIHKEPDGRSTYYVIPAADQLMHPERYPTMPAASQSALKAFLEGLRTRLAQCPEW